MGSRIPTCRVPIGSVRGGRRLPRWQQILASKHFLSSFYGPRLNASLPACGRGLQGGSTLKSGDGGHLPLPQFSDCADRMRMGSSRMCWEKPLHNNQQVLHQPRQLIRSAHVTGQMPVASDRHLLLLPVTDLLVLITSQLQSTDHLFAHTMNDPVEIYKKRCHYLFLCRYKLRIDLRCLKPYPVPQNASHPLDHLLPYLLNDKEFYQGRLYACNTPSNAWDFKIGAMLWEALGTEPDDFMVLCDSLINPKGRFWSTYTSRAPPRDRNLPNIRISLNDFMAEMNKWPPTDRNLVHSNILSSLTRYRVLLQRFNLGSF
jgi:hypothetical protein